MPSLPRPSRHSLLDWFLAARVLALVLAVRVALSVLPYRVVDRVLARPVRPRDASVREVRRVLRVVEAVTTRVLPQKPCLTQALVARRLLARRGFEVTLRIGVARQGEDVLQAHAWLERGGFVVLGGAASPGRYKVLEPVSPS